MKRSSCAWYFWTCPDKIFLKYLRRTLVFCVTSLCKPETLKINSFTGVFANFWLKFQTIFCCCLEFPENVFSRTGFKDSFWIGTYYSRQISSTSRRSSLQMIFKVGVLKNFANFTGKHPCQSLFLIKLHALRSRICKIFKNTSFTEHHRWLLLQSPELSWKK